MADILLSKTPRKRAVKRVVTCHSDCERIRGQVYLVGGREGSYIDLFLNAPKAHWKSRNYTFSDPTEAMRLSRLLRLAAIKLRARIALTKKGGAV